MKEKREASRSLSLWAYPGLLIVMLVSCGLISWFSLINPFVVTMELNDDYIYWESSNRTFSFIGDPVGRFYPYNPGGYYRLDLQGHLTCLWRRNTDRKMQKDWYYSEPPVQSLTPEQLAVLEARYGPIRGYDVVSPDITVLVTDAKVLWKNVNAGQLVVVNAATPEADTVIDPLTFYWTNIACENQQPYLILNGMALLASVVVIVKGIRRLRYKYLWLLAYISLIAVGLLFTYLLAHIDF